MKLELKRSINNKTYIFALASCVLSFILGYILLISIDKLETVPLNDFWFSVYTVYTQFGFLIFPVIVAFVYNIDYREKNILFYKTLGVNAINYYLSKLVVIILWFSVGTLGSLFITSILYQDFSNFLITFLHFESVLIYIILISSIFAFILKNLLVAFISNLFLWILGIVLATTNKVFEYLCYFDASLIRHENFEKFLKTGDLSYISVFNDWIYILAVFVIILFAVTISKKRWEKNGI